jgi:site-specific recombinase XerD
VNTGVNATEETNFNSNLKPGLDLEENGFTQTVENLVTRQLSAHTRKAYRQDASQFVKWLENQDLTLSVLSTDDIWQYRRYLADNFAKTTAERKLVVARKLLQEAVKRGLLSHNLAQDIGGYRSKDEQETPHMALRTSQARQLLTVIDTTTLQGKRDFAILLLLLRTGIRRSECADLKLGDLQEEQGHHLLVIRHAKGDKRRKVKVPVDVVRALDTYMEECARKDLNKEAPLFVQFRKGDHPQVEGISAQVIERLVKMYAARAGFELTPHGLRATFVTLALEAGAKLEQVQYAVGHSDPRTTERYQKRKLNLDNNAVDFVRVNIE